jgi:hypothetical protein
MWFNDLLKVTSVSFRITGGTSILAKNEDGTSIHLPSNYLLELHRWLEA